MGFLQNIYDNSPIFFQNLMCTIKGYKQNSERYGKEYWHYRNYYRKVDTLSLKKQEKIQVKKMKELLTYAVSNSPFYKELYKGIDISDIKEIKDLSRLPVVDKEMLRDNMDQIITIPKKKSVVQHTGGTTGKSLVVHMTVNDMKQRMAMLDNFKSRVGFENRKMRRATFNGQHIVPPSQKKKIFWRYNASCKQMIYSSFHLTNENMDAYIQSLNHFKPMALDGFFSSMCDLAGYIERNNIKIDFKPIAIFPTSETLTDVGRELLERVFKCKVYNQYASSEGAPFVTECPNQVLHMELTSGIFEHLDENSSDILVTSFTTHGTPLIRYKIDDSMIFADQDTCSCGLCGPIVKKIQGRKLDFLYTPDGAKINAGNVSNILKNIPNSIIKAQFIQNKMNEITVLLEVEKEKFSKSHEMLLKDEIIHKFGEYMIVNIKIINKIPKEESGKFRMIINNCYIDK